MMLALSAASSIYIYIYHYPIQSIPPFMLFAMLRLIQLDVTVLINNENSRTLSIVSEGQGEGTWRIKYDKPNFLSINYFQLTIYIKLSDTYTQKCTLNEYSLQHSNNFQTNLCQLFETRRRICEK